MIKGPSKILKSHQVNKNLKVAFTSKANYNYILYINVLHPAKI